MNKKVCIKIKGLHDMGDGSTDEDGIEVIYVGTCYKRNGKYYVKYEGPREGTDEITENLLKISSNEIEITPKSETGTHMLFTRGQKNRIFYNTPFGPINISVDTYDLNVVEEEDRILAEIRYDLEINQDATLECTVSIDITSLEDNK
jgi:uncharacterized beta-barrel protein YwiB (DUF1934 family)